MMDNAKRIAYNCKKATLLVEKKLVGRLTAAERIELNLHLAGCSLCRLFELQSANINKMLKSAVKIREQGMIKLDDKFKRDLQHAIDTRLNEK